MSSELKDKKDCNLRKRKRKKVTQTHTVIDFDNDVIYEVPDKKVKYNQHVGDTPVTDTDSCYDDDNDVDVETYKKMNDPIFMLFKETKQKNSNLRKAITNIQRANQKLVKQNKYLKKQIEKSNTKIIDLQNEIKLLKSQQPNI